MSRGPGKIERAIRARFDTHPDEAFTTDTLCAHCYGFEYEYEIERKHRVIVLRAADRVIARDPDWGARWGATTGREFVWFNQASLASTAMAFALRSCAAGTNGRVASSTRRVAHSYEYGQRGEARKLARLVLNPPPDEDAPSRCDAEADLDMIQRSVADHLALRAAKGPAGVAGRTKALRVVRTLGNFYGLRAIERHKLTRDVDAHRALIAEAAAQLRAVVAVSDPDAQRASILAIADALAASVAPEEAP